MIPALPRDLDHCEPSAACPVTIESLAYSHRCPYLDLHLPDYRLCAAMEET